LQVHSRVAGFYKIERVINAGSALEYKELLVDWFSNLILDIGLDRLREDYFNDYCLVGSGNTAPAVNNLSMQSFLGMSGLAISNYVGNSGSPDYYKYAVLVYRFNAGVATGNISEVGIGWGSASGQLFSRALVLDDNGDPTTITKLSDEVLDVTYQLRLYPKLTDVAGSFTFTGNKGGSYTYNSRAGQVSTPMFMNNQKIRPLFSINNHLIAYTGNISDVTGVPSGDIGSVNNISLGYTPGSFVHNVRATFSISQVNNALGIKSLYLVCEPSYPQFTWQFQLNTPIMKTSSDSLSIDLSYSWSR